METCSTLFSYHSRCTTTSLLQVKCEESFPHESRCHAIAETLFRRVPRDFCAFSLSSPSLGCVLIAPVKARNRNETQYAKRQYLFSVLKPCPNSSDFSSRVHSPFQLFSLPLDIPFRLSLDMAPEEVVGEHPSSVALCKDLDWEKLAEDLRKEAVSGITSDGSSTNTSKKVGVHQVDFELEPRNKARIQWDARSAAENLRSRVSFEVARELVRSKNCAIHDESTEIQRLQHQILTMCTYLNEHVSHNPAPDAVDSPENLEQQVKENRSSWFLSTIAALLLTETASIMDAIAAETGNPNMQESLSEPLEAASRAPTWLIPAILAFPVASYFLFNVYRDQVNPYAKLSDWLFGVVVLVIVGNLVTMATLGVRLY